MIRGTVSSRHEIVIQILVHDSLGQEQEIQAILDTGFDGSLTLPPATVTALGLPWRSRASAMLADGNIERFDTHSATVVWDGVPRSILVQAIDTTPLLGMALLVDFDLRVRVKVGGEVQIEAVP